MPEQSPVGTNIAYILCAECDGFSIVGIDDMRKGDSLYGVEVNILEGVTFWGSIILSKDSGVEHITSRVANVFKSKGFFLETLFSDRDNANNTAGFDVIFFTGKVKRVTDSKYDMYEMRLTYVLSFE